MNTNTPILTLDHVGRVFDVPHRGLGRRRKFHAVDDVSLTLAPGESLGLVGESGCGKSTLGRMVAGLIEPSVGEVRVNGQSRHNMSSLDRERWARGVQMIFQNPIASLNPRFTIRQTLVEPLRVHGLAADARTAAEGAERLALEVGFDPRLLDRRPHELSGGQCQRAGIARALSVAPELLVCDEPVSALDVSIQAQVLNLLADLRQRRSISYFFISHDLGVVERVSDRVGVMYLGQLVELAPASEIFESPQHPYTRLLLASVPRFDGSHAALRPTGDPASAMDPPPGCRFHPRCAHAKDQCRLAAPALRALGSGHLVACHFAPLPGRD